MMMMFHVPLTGACACARAAALKGGLKDPIRIYEKCCADYGSRFKGYDEHVRRNHRRLRGTASCGRS